MIAASANHDGIEGTDCGEVWISIVLDTILIMMSPYLKVLAVFFPFKETHFCPLCQPLPCYGWVNLVAHLVGYTADELRVLKEKWEREEERLKTADCKG
jgi:hypothetical protein